MKKISELIPLLLDRMRAELPPLLAVYGLPDFDAYGIGYPADQNKKYCALRYASGETGGDVIRFTFTAHIQLPGIPETDAYKYLDTVNGWLGRLDGSVYGYPLKTVSLELLENFHAGDIQAFFDAALSAAADDCGEEW